MNRYVLATILLLCSSAAFAEEYLIRVETIGYEDVPVSEKVPENQLLSRIEVIAGLNRVNESSSGTKSSIRTRSALSEAGIRLRIQPSFGI